ncbi:hypothetical protein VE02_06355 [Neofusicoccum parvum]|uniref:Uncharacterized protein n=2 Tax=Neofusicoccum parvum TaxID=310453 RepID=A0ACB5RY55_9PEZI|nr:putative maltose permease mal31 protein [Neofusicoccum parvum UCRNP2]GME25439.1 hypothetical protein VE02_06355 [Neofusicoccum parvum]GME60202.1 hypothetical protein VE02_06355 [Neofusicoccum parvum]
MHRAAQEASAAEHSTTFLSALRTHRRAVFWSMLVSTSIIMEGYDIVLVGSLFAQPAFQRRYGAYYPALGQHQVSGAWQAGLTNATTAGTIVGAFASGWLTERFGYRRVLLAALAAIAAFVSLTFFARSIEMLCVGEILCGVPWGVFATLAPAYAAELIAAGVLEGFSDWESQWAYRIPFAIQWAWPLPLLLILYFAPESPWWLVRRNDLAGATHSLSRLTTNQPHTTLTSTVALMVHTDAIERRLASGSRYRDCLRGSDRRRTEIACAVFAAQVWSGSQLGGAPAYFFAQAARLAAATAFRLAVGGLALACVGTAVSWFLMAAAGRRAIYVAGLAALAALMCAVGLIEVAAPDGPAASYAMGGVVLVWLFAYYFTVGPVCYAIIAEVGAAKLRAKTVCLSRISYYVAQIIGYTVEPYMLMKNNCIFKYYY